MSQGAEPAPLTLSHNAVVVMDDGRLVRFGSIPGVASLVAASSMPDDTTARLHGFGNGLSTDSTDSMYGVMDGTGVAIPIVREDYLGRLAKFLAYWDAASGFRWAQPLPIYPASNGSVVLTSAAVITTRGQASSVDAYARSDGGLLWGRDFEEFGSIVHGRAFVAGEGLYLSVQAGDVPFDQRQPVRRLLSLDPLTGATLWDRELPRAADLHSDSIEAVQSREGGLLVTSLDYSLTKPTQIRLNFLDSTGVPTAERLISLQSTHIEDLKVSPDNAGAQDVVAIAIDSTSGSAMMLVDRTTGDVRWLHETTDLFPQFIWTTAHGVLTHDRQIVPDTHGIVRLRSNADGALLWTHLEPIESGETLRPGNVVGDTLVLPVEKSSDQQVRIVRIDIGTGTVSRSDFPPLSRKLEPTTAWVQAGPRLLNGRIDGSPELGTNFSAVAVQVGSGTELWRTQSAVAPPPWAPVAPAGLIPGSTSDHVLAWAALKEGAAPPIELPEKLVARAIETNAGATHLAFERMITLNSAAVIPAVGGGMVAAYAPCAVEPCWGPTVAHPFVLERISADGQSNWVRDGAASSSYPHMIPVSADASSVYVYSSPSSGQSFGIGATAMSDGNLQWFEALPSMTGLPSLHAVPGWPLQFRGRDRVSQKFYFGRRDGQTGAVIWRSDGPQGNASVNTGAQLQLLDGSWLATITGASLQGWMNFTLDGTLRWSTARTPGNWRASVRRIWQLDADRLLAETGISSSKGYLRRVLTSVDAQTGEILGERLIDAVDEESSLGRSRAITIVAPRANGGIAVSAPIRESDGVLQYYLQGWAAPSAARRSPALSVNSSSLANGHITALGRVSRVILKVTREPDGGPMNAVLTYRSDFPVAVRLVGCRLSGGACTSTRTRQELPLNLTLGSGEIELDVEVLDSVYQTPTGTIDFHLDPDFDVLDTTLSDNDVSVYARFGPFSSGFE